LNGTRELDHYRMPNNYEQSCPGCQDNLEEKAGCILPSHLPTRDREGQAFAVGTAHAHPSPLHGDHGVKQLCGGILYTLGFSL